MSLKDIHLNLKKMKNDLAAVGIVTGILIVFVTLIQFEVSLFLIWLIFLAGPFLVIWMVYSVLIADVDIQNTFEEQWYQDEPNMLRMAESD
jgi:fatty acid desaturase